MKVAKNASQEQVSTTEGKDVVDRRGDKMFTEIAISKAEPVES